EAVEGVGIAELLRHLRTIEGAHGAGGLRPSEVRGQRVACGTGLEQESAERRTPTPARGAEVGIEAGDEGAGALGVVPIQVANRNLLEQVVAPEQLVSPLARGHYGDPVRAHLAGEQKERHGGGA